jgi:hypothetical protein
MPTRQAPKQDAFEALRAKLADARVEPVAKRGKINLTVDGKVFAFPLAGRIALKLPAARCQALVDAGRAVYLVMGKRTMKAWVTVAADTRELPKLAREALACVTSSVGKASP